MNQKTTPDEMAKEVARIIYNTPREIVEHMDNRLKELRYNLPPQCNNSCVYCFPNKSN